MKPPIALLTPMANPTVEREMRQLLPATVDYVVGRLTGPTGDSLARLRSYAECLPDQLAQFGGMELGALAFACTASSYLIGAVGEARIGAALGVPVIWAAAAIRSELARRGARRIAVLSPYPEAIHRAALAYWQAAGLAVVGEERVEIGSADTRAIYALTAGDASAACARLAASGADAVLLSGTGMPSLALLSPDGQPAVLSSNLCLARRMCEFAEKAE